MKIPVPYEVNGRRRCLLVQDGETIGIGRAESCAIRLNGEGLRDVEMTAQFVNGCQLVVVHPGDGRVSYAQPLPWRLKVAGVELEIFCPFKPKADAADGADSGSPIWVQGLGAEEIHVAGKRGEPLLLGSGSACDVVVPEAACPVLLLGLWTLPGHKLHVQVLDESAVVGWLGRSGEMEADLALPVSLSIGGRVLLIRSGAESPAKPVLTAQGAAPAILTKNADAYPKIVSRLTRTESPARNLSPSGKVLIQAPLSSPIGTTTLEPAPLLVDPAAAPPKPYTPVLFILASWLLVALTFAVALLPGRAMLPPDQILLLWKASGVLLLFTQLLGLGVLLK